MAKALYTLVLLLIIACTSAFSVLYYSFNLSDPANTINTTLRKRILMYPMIRKALRLQQVGDARFEYMYHRSLPLEIYLYNQQGVQLESETVEKIQREIQYVTHKYAAITVHDSRTLYNISDSIDDDEVNTILDLYAPDTSLISKTVPLHIFLLSYYSPHPSYAGMVTDAHSIMLFKDAIVNVSESQRLMEAVEISTILHEFAHLGGAEHIENPDCVLADTVENLDFFNKIRNIRDSYCDEDLEAIKNAIKI